MNTFQNNFPIALQGKSLFLYKLWKSYQSLQPTETENVKTTESVKNKASFQKFTSYAPLLFLLLSAQKQSLKLASKLKLR